MVSHSESCCIPSRLGWRGEGSTVVTKHSRDSHHRVSKDDTADNHGSGRRESAVKCLQQT